MQKLDYKQTFAISQSAIKCFKNKPLRKFKQIYIDKEEDDENQDKFALGSLVDTLAFEPHLMDERFFIPADETSVPGEKVKTIVNKVFKEAQQIIEHKMILNEQGNLPEPLYIPNLRDLFEWEHLILEAAKSIKYGGTTWSRNRIMDNVFEEGGAYFGLLAESNGRVIITPVNNADAIEMVNALQNDPRTRPFFVQQEGETLLFQQEIFIEYPYKEMVLPLKGALDIIRLNDLERWVQVPDLKTSFDSEGFDYQAGRFDYVYQASFYNFLVREWLKTYEGGKYENYDILNPTNIVIDKNAKVPYIYEYDWEDIEIAQDGSKALNVKGWKAILEEIGWHITTGVWDRPKELYETGKIKLKIFNK